MERRDGVVIVVAVGCSSALLAIGLASAQPLVAVAFLAAVPCLAAAWSRSVAVAVVSAVSVVAGIAITVTTQGGDLRSALPILIGLVVLAGGAVIAAAARDRRPRAPSRPGVAQVGPASGGERAEGEGLDPVTGLPTRSLILARFAADPPPRPALLALVDVDDLAGFNDAHGGGIGDTLLFAIGGRTRYALDELELSTGESSERSTPTSRGNETQWVARWGDDEFLVVLTPMDAGAADALRALLAKVNEHPIRSDAGLVPATVGCGAVVWTPDEDLLHAVSRARRALHRAKSRGSAALEIDAASEAHR